MSFSIFQGGRTLKHINFKLPEINRKLTKEAVEERLSKLSLYWLTEPPERIPKITSSYSLIPPSQTNQPNSSTEDAAIKNVDIAMERSKYIKQMMTVINRLAEVERTIIIKEYLDNNYRYNYEIFNELGISESQYYKLKGRAFYKIALMLRIEVYHNRKKVAK